MTSLMTSQKNGSMENFNFFEISKLTPSSLQNNINQKLYIFLILKMIPDSREAGGIFDHWALPKESPL